MKVPPAPLLSQAKRGEDTEEYTIGLVEKGH